MLGMLQLLNILLTFYFLEQNYYYHVHATFVNISAICQSECFECIFMTIDWFHPILFKFYRYLKFHMLFFNFHVFFPKSRECVTEYSAYTKQETAFFFLAFTLPKMIS
jgi:hypothetical protein